MPTPRWSGRKVERIREYFRRTLVWPTPCGVCGRPVHVDSMGRGGRSGWVIGHHPYPRSTHPEYTWALWNMRVEHSGCSARTGTRQQNAAVRARALAEYGIVEPVSNRPAWLAPRPRRSRSAATTDVYAEDESVPETDVYAEPEQPRIYVEPRIW